MGDLIFALLLVVILCGALWGAADERAAWNSGHCRRDGFPWVRFDTDSQSGRGYKCACGHYIWISWPIEQEASDGQPKKREVGQVCR